MIKQILNNRIERIENTEKKIFSTLFGLLLISIISYGFLLNSTMMNAVSKQTIQKQIASFGADVNSLEFQYLNIKNSITLTLAQSKGFIVIPSDKFATIDPTQKNLSLSINEN